MGEVYRATNVSLGRKVAIKLLSPEFVHIEEDVLRFLREARAAAAVRHSNVVDVIDVARDDDGTPFIVQELLAGEDLERYLRARNGRLSSEEALEIMIPVADAVAVAHAQNVVHRDLKPANIFLARERNKITPKVLDFGACLFPTIAERSAKEVRMLIGTPHYMAPEQIVSKQDVDTRSDVWALGVILYELIVGETPFEAGTANEVLQLVKTRDVPPLRERAPDASPELEALIARCTRRDRLARFRDAGELHAKMLEVRRELRGGPVSARMETLVELPAPPRAATDQLRPPARKTSPSAPSMAAAALNAPSLDQTGARFKVPSLDQLHPPAAPPNRAGLLTLSSPGSEPPASLDALDLDIPLPIAADGGGPGSPSPPASAQRQIAAPRVPGFAQALLDPSGVRQIDPDDTGPTPSLDLAARPSSWPPAKRNSSSSPPHSSTSQANAPSSLPPVLDPRAFGKAPSPIPPAPLPREAREPRDAGGTPPEGVASPTRASVRPRPPAVAPVELASARSARAPGWNGVEVVKFVAAVAVPAIAAFVGVLAVPALGSPVARALRGDSMFASGVLAVVALVAAAALFARSILGERSRWLYVATAGGVLFGIVMIIVTFAASEAAELGVPSSMGGLSSIVAPIAPLALGLGAFAKARAAWVDPYSRSEAIRHAALASAMLFVTLALSPVGVVRLHHGRPSQPTHKHVSG